MQLDGFTFIAQIINFVLLIIILRIVLYKPIIRVMQEREARIVAKLKEAEQKQQEASEQLAAYRSERQALDEQRAELLAEARQAAKARREELEAQYHEEIAQSRLRWREALQAEKQEFLQHLRQRLSDEVFAIARRTLADLADIELEKRIVAVFIERIENMDADQRQVLAQDARKNADRPLVVRTAFEVEPEMQQTIRETLERCFHNGVKVRFETGSGLIGGVQLKTHSQEIAWNIDSYLDVMESRLAEAFAAQEEQADAERISETDRSS